MDTNPHLVGQTTVSGKIRALAAAGYSRADIARMLGKRYQHVRNVLEATPGLAEKGRRFQGPPVSAVDDIQDRGAGIYRLSVRTDGSVLLPTAVREAWNVVPGGAVMANFDGETLSLVSTAIALRRAQIMVRAMGPHDKLLSDELIEDRRREVEAERDKD